MVQKFCVYCQEVTQDYINEFDVLECTNCEPLSESEEDEISNDDSYDSDFTVDTDDSDFTDDSD